MVPPEGTCHPSIAMQKRRAAERWTQMAAEARAIASRTRDPVSKRTMLEIAVSYDKLAERADELARVHGGTRRDDTER